MWQRWNQSTHIFEKSTDNGGSWTPLGLNASIITEGTLPDARLSSNVALENIGNTFTAGQVIQGPDARLVLTTGNGIWQNIHATPYGLDLSSNIYWNGSAWATTNGSYPNWMARISAYEDVITISRSAAGSSALAQLVKIDNTGKIYERARTYAMSQRIPWTPTLYTAEGGPCGGSMSCSYSIAGDMLFWSVYIVNFNNPGAGTGYLRFTMPPDYPPSVADVETSIVRIYVPGIGDNVGFTQNNASGGYPGFVQVYRIPIVGWPAGLGHIIGQGRYFIG
jgi:hypothetical protein